MFYNKKICFISGGLKGGGQERALTSFANEFAKNGYEVTILCLFKTEIFFKIHKNIRIIWPDIGRDKYNKFIYAFRLIPFIRKKILHINPDIIISFGDWYNSYVIISTLFLKKKVFITNRMGPNLNYGLLFNLVNKITYPLASGMIVQTQRAKEIMQKKYFLNQVQVVENILNPIDINTDELNPQNNIITIGRLSKEKGQKLVIEAFSKMKYKSEWNLQIIGDGPDLESLMKLCINLKIEKQVKFHGHLKDFKNILAEASIFVLPSYFEGFPNALIEAMSIPLVCVSSDCVAGPREIIKNGINGFLFETGSVNDLVKSLDEIIEDKQSWEIIQKESYKVRINYSKENSYKKLENIILN